jgi:SprT protein
MKKAMFTYMEEYKTILQKYIPEAAIDQIYQWLQEYHIHLKISRKRSSKLGDYRSPHKGKGHQITVNHDLNPYAFLITLVHEIAHMLVWEKYRNRVRAHGKEWKETYRELMVPFFKMDIFPEDVESAITNYLSKSYASSGSDLNLGRTLQKYDADQGLTLENIPEGSIFSLPNGMAFKKGTLNRKRYRCTRMDNNKVYLVNALVRVELLESP